MTHHGNEEEHEQELQAGPVLHGGDGDPLGGSVAEAADDQAAGGTNQPPLPDDEPKPGL